MNKVVTKTATIYMDENSILHVEPMEGVRVDYEDAIDNYLVMKHLANNQKVLKLIDSRMNWSLEKKARQFIDSKEVEEKTIARAVVHANTFQSMITKFYMGINKPHVPTKVFSDYNEAYNWLLSFKTK